MDFFFSYYLGPQYLLILFHLTDIFPIIYIKVYALRASKLS